MGYRLSGARSGGRAGEGVTSPGLECARGLGRDLGSQSLPLPHRAVPGAPRSSLSVPFGPGSWSATPSCPRGPFLNPPLLPPLSAAVTKLSSQTAVLVRPPLPTARGGSHGASQHPRWLQSRHFSGSGRPNPHTPFPQGSRSALRREPHPALSATVRAGPQEGLETGWVPLALASRDQ